MLRNPSDELTTCLLQKSHQPSSPLHLVFTCIYNTDTLLTRGERRRKCGFGFQSLLLALNYFYLLPWKKKRTLFFTASATGPLYFVNTMESFLPHFFYKEDVPIAIWLEKSEKDKGEFLETVNCCASQRQSHRLLFLSQRWRYQRVSPDLK